MLKFYYHPLSPIARRVWLMLLEKQIPFESVILDIRSQNAQLLAVNPFHHVPVIVDGDLRLLESLAIMDYLELKYPQPALLPTTVVAIAKMRMVQMVAMNELMPLFPFLIMAQPLAETTERKLRTALAFLTEELGTAPYFGGEQLNLADVMMGATLPLIHRLGYGLENYPSLNAWRERISDRPAWRTTEPDPESFQRWQRWIKILIQRKSLNKRMA